MGRVSVTLTFRIQVQVRPDPWRYLVHILREFMFGIGSRSNEEELVSFDFGFIFPRTNVERVSGFWARRDDANSHFPIFSEERSHGVARHHTDVRSARKLDKKRPRAGACAHSTETRTPTHTLPTLMPPKGNGWSVWRGQRIQFGIQGWFSLDENKVMATGRVSISVRAKVG